MNRILQGLGLKQVLVELLEQGVDPLNCLFKVN